MPRSVSSVDLPAVAPSLLATGKHLNREAGGQQISEQSFRQCVDRRGGECNFLGHDRLQSAPGADQNTSEIRSEEHTSELQSLMRISYAVFCLKKKKKKTKKHN